MNSTNEDSSIEGEILRTAWRKRKAPSSPTVSQGCVMPPRLQTLHSKLPSLLNANQTACSVSRA